MASSLGFVAYAASTTVTPICLVILARELHFSLTAAGGLEVARSLLIVVSLLLSGFFSGWFGKVRSLGVSCLIIGFGMMVYALSPTYGVVVLAMAMMGFGGGVLDGLINPLVQELHPGNSGRYLNIINGFWSVGVLLTMLLTGQLLTQEVSWRLVVTGLGAISFGSGILFLLLQREAVPRERLSLAHVLKNKLVILRQPRFWTFFVMMILAGAAEGAFTFWSASLIQLEYGKLPLAGGIGTAFFAAGMIIGRFGSGWLVKQADLWHLLLFSSLAGTFLSVLIPLAESIHTAYLSLFLAGLAVACLWPSLQSYAADRIPDDATSLLILLSCGGVIGFATVSWVMGLIGDVAGLSMSFWCIPPAFAALAILLMIERSHQQTHRDCVPSDQLVP